MPDSILISLREGTAAAHQAMEEEMDMESACHDLTRYRRILEGFLGYYEPLEGRLKILPAMAYRSKVAWLEEDLRNLGLDEEDISQLPRCDFTPILRNQAEALGCAYVLEGATLGGRQISSWLKDSNVPEKARRFFASYGANVGERWKAFCADLQNFEASGGDTEAAVHSANDTFSTLNQWMKQRS